MMRWRSLTHSRRSFSSALGRIDASQLHRARMLASEIKAGWRRSGKPNVGAALADNPLLGQHHSLVLDLAFEEYCLLSEQNPSVDPEEFVQAHPTIDHSLLRLIEVHEFFRQHPTLLPGVEKLAWPTPGSRLFTFDVAEEIGQGAIARVYLCREYKVGGRQVVLKVAPDGAYEAVALGKLAHPNIMPIYSMLEAEDSALTALCMPFRGRSTLCDVLDCAWEAPTRRPTNLQVIHQAARRHQQADDRYDRVGDVPQLLKQGSYVDGVCALALQLASALQHAHERGVIHADLKPSNVLLTPSAAVQILDFNLSIDEQHADTATGGTLLYMPPERIRSIFFREESKAEAAAVDVYSLGVILYQLLSGKLPFYPESIAAPTKTIARQLLDQQQAGCTPLQSLNPDIDDSVARLIHDCLAFRPEDRPQSMSAIEDALQRYFSPAQRRARWAKRHRTKLGAGFVAALLLAATLAAFAATGLSPHDKQYRLGCDYLREGHYAAAIEHFDHALIVNPDDPEVYFQRGVAHLQLKQYEFASRDFSRAEKSLQNGHGAAGFALCMNRIGDSRSAINWYERAVQKRFATPALYNNLGYSLFLTKKYPEAADAFIQAEKLGGDSGIFYLNWMLLELQLSRQPAWNITPQALEIADKAVEREPTKGRVAYIAALLYGQASQTQPALRSQALEYLSRAADGDVDLKRVGAQVDPAFSQLRNHPRFRELMARPAPVRPETTLDHLLSPWT